jgi:hypothetical protein
MKGPKIELLIRLYKHMQSRKGRNPKITLSKIEQRTMNKHKHHLTTMVLIKKRRVR